jgi:GT2 family glycosyltransferase
MSLNPTISIILVTWNSKDYLPKCLSALSKQTFRDFEVIVVDNGSTDGLLNGFEKQIPDFPVRIERLTSNLGFATANNLGARLARGQWLALLNADAFPEPEWLACLLEAAKRYPNASFASRQLQANTPGYLDGEGDAYHISGLGWRRNYGHPVQEKSEIEEIFSPCAAAALYPRQVFLDAKGFDEDYFSYHEDVDLGFRLRLKGLRCFYVPTAVVHHVGSASTGKHSDFAIYHGHRNLEWTYIKNMPRSLFWIFLPLHLLANVLTFFKFLLTGHGKAIWRAKIDAVRHLALMLRKRKNIQQHRNVSPMEIYRMMDRGLLDPLLVSIQRRRFGNYRE